MNKQQLEAIKNFKKAFLKLEKMGLYLFLHESGLCVCDKKDINKNIKDPQTGVYAFYGDDWHQIKDVFNRNKVTFLGIDIDSFNA